MSAIQFSLSKTVAAILKTVYERELGVGDGILSSFKRDTENSSIVDRALDCRAGGCGFDSRGRTQTLGVKYYLCPKNSCTFAWLGSL